MKTESELISDYQALKQEIESAKASLAVLKARYKSIEDQIQYIRWGVKPGILIRCGKDVFRVLGIRAEFMFLSGKHKPWLFGNLRRKDDTFSKQCRTIFRDWEIINPA